MTLINLDYKTNITAKPSGEESKGEGRNLLERTGSAFTFFFTHYPYLPFNFQQQKERESLQQEHEQENRGSRNTRMNGMVEQELSAGLCNEVGQFVLGKNPPLVSSTRDS